MITNEMVHRAAWSLAVDQYVAGKSVAKIAKEINRSPSTVTEHMKRAGVYQPGRKGGAPKQEFCKEGHSMGDFGKWIDEEHHEKGRFCSECKRKRERKGD